MTVGDVYAIIDSIAPFSSQEEWDNTGLLAGSRSAPVTGILFALDVTEAVIQEAVDLRASLIVTHHPLMFSPRRRLTDDDYEGRLIAALIRRGISLIAAHTNLDRAPGGINDVLAALCGLDQVAGEDFFRCGMLPEPVTARAYADSLRDSLFCTVRLMGPENRVIRKVGVSSGGGGDAWEAAVLHGCDAFVTGEMKHHLALAAADAGLVTMECGHFATEEPGIRALAEALQKALDAIEWNVGVYVSEVPSYSFPQRP